MPLSKTLHSALFKAYKRAVLPNQRQAAHRLLGIEKIATKQEKDAVNSMASTISKHFKPSRSKDARRPSIEWLLDTLEKLDIDPVPAILKAVRQ